MTCKILLIGSGGQLGTELVYALSALGEVTCWNRSNVDLSDLAKLKVKLDAFGGASHPDIVVNAAAFTSVDNAESNVELVNLINVEAPRVIAEYCNRINSIFIHYSTDYVFDGAGSTPWLETDMPKPLSVYGVSKYKSEVVVAAACSKFIILRSSWIMSAEGSNFLKTILNLSAARETIRVVSDQIGAPTSTNLISNITVIILKTMLLSDVDDPRWGIYHLTSSGAVSWFEYAKYVVQGARIRGADLKLLPELVLPIPSSQYPVIAQRPLNSRLSTQKLRNTFNVVLPDWQTQVDKVLNQIYSTK